MRTTKRLWSRAGARTLNPLWFLKTDLAGSVRKAPQLRGGSCDSRIPGAYGYRGDSSRDSLPLGHRALPATGKGAIAW